MRCNKRTETSGQCPLFLSRPIFSTFHITFMETLQKSIGKRLFKSCFKVTIVQGIFSAINKRKENMNDTFRSEKLEII